MLTAISQVEAVPAAYPSEVDDALWQRIEQWVAHRWTEREVIWIVDGPGEWVPPLTPATITATEVWRSGAYQAATPDASPRGGLELTEYGPWRITATVGADNNAPAAVLTAFDRLKAYVEAETGDAPGASSYSYNLGAISETIRRHPAHMARAIHNSGAADLLRKYRRA